MKRDKDYKVTIIKNNTFSECMYLKAASEKDAVRMVIDVMNNVSLYDFSKNSYRVYAIRIKWGDKYDR